VITALMKCHKENKYSKFFGKCNQARRDLDKCLNEEYEEYRQLRLSPERKKIGRNEKKRERRIEELEKAKLNFKKVEIHKKKVEKNVHYTMRKKSTV